ncbi:MAG: glycoside hydrolase family 31 protein [Breznakibacter sp.]
MPYVYAQAKQSSGKGLPMVRALLLEFPDDPGAWLVDNQYMFGSDMLVAPLFESNATAREVYLPKGKWIDYQTGKAYDGGWHRISAGEIPIVLLVRDGAVIPHIKPGQSTSDMDWTKLELTVYSVAQKPTGALVCLPSDNVLQTIAVSPKGSGFEVVANPFGNKVAFKIVKPMN